MRLEDIQDFKRLDLLAKQLAEGNLVGLHKSPYHGYSVEFSEHRNYNPGESVRFIDWKVFAKTDRLYIRKFEEETNLQCRIILDGSSSMHFPNTKEDPSATITKAHFSAISAAAFCYLLNTQRDQFGLCIEQKEQVLSEIRGSKLHISKLLVELEHYLKANQQVEVDMRKQLHQMSEIHKGRHLFIMFSDFIPNSNQDIALWSEAFKHCHYNKHELLLIRTFDSKFESDFEYPDKPIILVDSETGQKTKLHPNEIRERYTQQYSEYYSQFKETCRKFKVEYVEADIRQPLDHIIPPYLALRKKHKI